MLFVIYSKTSSKPFTDLEVFRLQRFLWDTHVTRKIVSFIKLGLRKISTSGPLSLIRTMVVRVDPSLF